MLIPFPCPRIRAQERTIISAFWAEVEDGRGGTSMVSYKLTTAYPVFLCPFCTKRFSSVNHCSSGFSKGWSSKSVLWNKIKISEQEWLKS